MNHGTLATLKGMVRRMYQQLNEHHDARWVHKERQDSIMLAGVVTGIMKQRRLVYDERKLHKRADGYENVHACS